MSKLEINQTQIHFQCMGDGEPIIMLHGLLIGNMASWYFGIASQLSKNFSVILYDLRGHGLSDKAKSGYDLLSMVNDLEMLIQKLNLKIVSLIGHSYGALIALHYAIKNPHQVKQLICVEAPLPPSKTAQIEIFLQKNPQDVALALPEQLQKIVFTQKRQAQKFLERIQFLLFETDLVENLKNEKDIDDSLLRSLNIPTLLIYGRNGDLIEVAQRLLQMLPKVSLQYLEGGHYLPSEKPHELFKVIYEFYSNQRHPDSLSAHWSRQ